MKNLISVFTILCFTLLTNIGFAQELLVLSGENSQNSKRWQEEVLPEYSASAPGKNLPVKIVPVKGNRFPEWLAKALDEGRVGAHARGWACARAGGCASEGKKQKSQILDIDLLVLVFKG